VKPMRGPLSTLLFAASLVVSPGRSQGKACAGSALASPGTAADADRMTVEEQRFLDLINAERRQRGCRELTANATLVRVARDHSLEMASRGYFSHQSPTRSQRTPMKRYVGALARRPRSACVGENLFFCTRVDVPGGHRTLMRSPSHRANILYQPFREAGVGIYKSPRGEFWVTEMFLTNEE
jgi:uncharacterized protein YkwD